MDVRDTGSRGVGKPNYLAGFFGWFWLAVVIIPIYYVVVTSLKNQGDYFTANPLALPIPPTFHPYQEVIANNIGTYFLNSVIVAVGAVIPIVIFAFMAAYALVRGQGRFLRFCNGLFLMGLAIPVQATIVPIYLMITKMGLYDTLPAIILPAVAFGQPLSILIVSNFVRDIPKELFESMRLDGLTDWRIMWRLAFPLTSPALVTVAIYQGLNVWNGFLFPLILTQSPDKRTMPLGLWAFQGEYTVNIPAILAAVIVSTVPILVLYVIGRRQLLSGLTAGIGK
ncbi:MAG: carbohydrate ABC transporter permease [Propionibacteriaceae bacterium]